MKHLPVTVSLPATNGFGKLERQVDSSVDGVVIYELHDELHANVVGDRLK